ncbi:hypothetical protein GQ457_17G001470 [Hibiscus cannabinus]
MEMVAISVLLVLTSLPNKANACPQVPCYFVFGDSLSDNENNNNLPMLAKVNYPPYGVDLPQGPTGRFCNGRNIHDFIAQLLRFKDYIPAFATLRGRNIFNGVNYASGSAGIRNETGSNKIKNHKTIISMITRLMGNYSATNSLLKQCIYSVQIGSNDYINNYFKPEFYETSRCFTPSEYATLLVQQLSLQLKTLYNYGARKFAVYGIGQIGCTPYAILMYGSNGSDCISKLNEGATLFNDRLKPLIHQLNINLSDAKFTYLNPSGGPDAATLGGVVFWLHIVGAFSGDCSVLHDQGGGGELCLLDSNSSKYVVWDGVHPTEALNKMVAKRTYTSESPLEASPLNIQQLTMWRLVAITLETMQNTGNAQVNLLDNSGTCFNTCCVNLASSAASHGPINADNWIIDSGATHHVTPDGAKVSHGSDYNGPATTVHQTHNTSDGGTRVSHGHASGSNEGSHTSQGHDNQAMSSDDAMSAREVLDTSARISVDGHNSVSADLGQTESQDVQSSSIHSDGTHGLSESRQACDNDTEVAISSEQAVVSAQTDRHEFLVRTQIVFINKQQHYLKFFHPFNNNPLKIPHNTIPQPQNSFMSPCRGFLGHGYSDPSAECCGGVKKIAQLTKTKRDEQELFEGIKYVMRNYGAYDTKRLSVVGQKCDADISFPPITANTDCFK